MANKMVIYPFCPSRFRYHPYHTVKNTIPYTEASGTASPQACSGALSSDAKKRLSRESDPRRRGAHNAKYLSI